MNILGIGTDIVECSRIGRMIARHGELFLTRVYTQHEIDYCNSRKAALQHFSGRWAAKEAILKALGYGWTRGMGWTDLEIRNDQNGLPRVRVGGGARDLCERLRVSQVLISISHCHTHATAYATALTADQPPAADDEA
jgi:holo-[acyl-carrier protein] synthase